MGLGFPGFHPFGTQPSLRVALSEGGEEAFARAEAQAARQAQAVAQRAQAGGEVPRLMRLQSAFGLDRFELDALLIYLAPALDLRYCA